MLAEFQAALTAAERETVPQLSDKEFVFYVMLKLIRADIAAVQDEQKAIRRCIRRV